MKSIQLLLLLIINIACKAQSPIINILDDDGEGITNAYYKDVNNLLNQYEGTYIYTNGTTSFKIVLVKKIMKYNSLQGYYEDLIIGEYQYIENGVEKVNTLSELNLNLSHQFLHNIHGNSLIDKNNRSWVCSECGVNEKRLEASIRDASSNRFAEIVMRRTTILDINGTQDVLQIKINHVKGYTYIEGQPIPADFSLPIGEFTLIKQ